MTLDFQRKIDSVVGSFLIGVFRVPAMVLGSLLRRNHDARVQKELVILKIRGGGSLFMALPSLLALRRAHPGVRMILICSNSVEPFARMLNCFDEFVTVNVSGLIPLLTSSLRALARCWRCDTVADLEIHSKMTTLFCLFLCARNRLGFYMAWDRWKNGLTTHALFFNESSPVYESYEHVAVTLGAQPASMVDASRHLRQGLGLPADPAHAAGATDNITPAEICLAPYTTELGREREFSATEWGKVLTARYAGVSTPVRVRLLGGPAEVPRAPEFVDALRRALPANFEVANDVGTMKLADVARFMDRVGTLYSIDGGLNHIARLLRVQIVSYWGPTDPYLRLKPIEGWTEQVYYQKIFCSPCVHVVTHPPCKGDNLCMKQHLGLPVGDILSRGWLVAKGRIGD